MAGVVAVVVVAAAAVDVYIDVTFTGTIRFKKSAIQ